MFKPGDVISSPLVIRLILDIRLSNSIHNTNNDLFVIKLKVLDDVYGIFPLGKVYTIVISNADLLAFCEKIGYIDLNTLNEKHDLKKVS